MSDTHVRVVHDHREIVRGRSVGTQYNEVIKLFVVEDHPTLDLVINDDFAVKRIPEADDGIHALPGFCSLSTAAIVAGLVPRRHLLLTEIIQFRFGAIAVIGIARR
jgi:hypothetical protein